MMLHPNAAHAYGASRAALPVRAQEADVFRRVTGGLRAVQAARTSAGASSAEVGLRAVRALADNRRLWLAVEGALVDPTNGLPPPLRASIISVGRTVLREMDRDEPDFAFLIEVNENVAAGLSASA